MQYKTTLAFPVSALVYNYDDKAPDTIVNEGMTLRDYFAAKAMQGMLAACTGWSEQEQERLAKCSYMMADEMLKRREQ
jgi:hypothetical protein